MLTFLGWALIAFAAILFVVLLAGFVNPVWLADKKSGKVPSRWMLLLAAWISPSVIAAVGGTILFMQSAP